MVVPEELVGEILVRLPAKSLMRFKSVERSWNDLFRTPSFIKSHHTQMQILHRNENLLMISHPDKENHRCFTLISDSSQSESQFDMKYIFPDFETRSSLREYLLDIILYGHCNGVLCLYLILRDRDEIPNKLILWNPATREVKVVPLPPHLLSHFAICGFSVDPNSNDLKVVYLSFESEPPIAEMYNLSTDSWTLIRNGNDDTVPVDSTHRMMTDPKTYTVNGVCYWVDALWGQGFLSFDFRDNQFRKIKTPPTESLDILHNFVTEVNGFLAYAVNCSLSYDTCKYELWIMEQDRWSKIYNIGPFDFQVGISAIWKNGTEFLGGSPDGSLVSYNSYGQPVRRFTVPFIVHIHAADYVESIAPLSF